MSFKRKGDDVAMLRNLQNRRVADLLANYIPDDEASLLSNGRLTCMVCSHRPIFDTLSILSIHRKGKKHIAELGKNLAQKREQDRRKLKTNLSPHTGNSSQQEPSTAPVLGKRLVTTTPYSSCVKKNKNKFQGLNRRSVLDVDCADLKTSTADSSEVNDGLPSCSVEVRRYLKALWKKKSMEKTVAQRRENYGNRPTMSNEAGTKVNTRSTIETQTQPQPLAGSCVTDAEQSEKLKLAQHELQLKMSGWLKNADGEWVKDPEAEFDSDEDLPTLPPD